MSPPETIVFADSIQWLGNSLTGGNQYQYAANLDTTDITNYDLLEQLAVGQSIACKIKINGVMYPPLSQDNSMKQKVLRF